MVPSGFAAIVLFSLLGAMAAWFLALKLLCKRLQRFHPDVHASLGRPGAFVRNTTSTRSAVVRFLAAGRHRALDDRRLARFGDATLGALLLTAAVGVAAIVMAVLWPPAR